MCVCVCVHLVFVSVLSLSFLGAVYLLTMATREDPLTAAGLMSVAAIIIKLKPTQRGNMIQKDCGNLRFPQ